MLQLNNSAAFTPILSYLRQKNSPPPPPFPPLIPQTGFSSSMVKFSHHHPSVPLSETPVSYPTQHTTGSMCSPPSSSAQLNSQTAPRTSTNMRTAAEFIFPATIMKESTSRCHTQENWNHKRPGLGTLIFLLPRIMSSCADSTKLKKHSSTGSIDKTERMESCQCR